MSDNNATTAAPEPWPRHRLQHQNSLTLKAVAAAVLSVFALIPLFLVEDLVRERWSRELDVVNEIGQVWGAPQLIAGPYLEIPYTTTKNHPNGTSSRSSEHLIVFPESLDISVEMQPEMRRRGIFEALVYVANVGISGAFSPIEPSLFPADAETIEWDKASLRLNFSDVRNVRGDIQTLWHGSPIDFADLANPPVILGTRSVLGADVRLPQEGVGNQNNTFQISYQSAGSHRLDIAPTAGKTQAMIQSPWPSPSFDGAFLPASADMSADGFVAHWAVADYARGFPLVSTNLERSRLSASIDQSIFGLRLIKDVGLYRKTERAVKYGLLFFATTFLTFLVLEVTSGAKLHILHYGLVGSALCIFYVLLLSLAEIIGFPAAFAISATAVIVQTSLFTWSVIKRLGATLIFGAVMAGVYAYLYVLLDLEDVALLGGALGLFVLLSVAMYALRGIGTTASKQPSNLAASAVSS